MRLPGRRVDRSNNQQRRVLRHGLTAVLQNHPAALVIPILKDVLEDVHVSARRHGLEEIACYSLATIREPYASDKLPRRLNYLWLVEQNTPEAGSGLEDSCEQFALPPADIHEGAETREVVSRRERFCFPSERLVNASAHMVPASGCWRR